MLVHGEINRDMLFVESRIRAMADLHALSIAHGRVAIVNQGEGFFGLIEGRFFFVISTSSTAVVRSTPFFAAPHHTLFFCFQKTIDIVCSQPEALTGNQTCQTRGQARLQVIDPSQSRAPPACHHPQPRSRAHPYHFFCSIQPFFIRHHPYTINKNSLCVPPVTLSSSSVFTKVAARIRAREG
jgi:hypothetical protein